MPTYEYACRGCGQHLEVVQSFKDDALTECPSCQGALRKVFSAAGIIFKGSGWHVKDYAGSSKAATASASDGDRSSGPTEGPSTGSTSSDAGPSSGSPPEGTKTPSSTGSDAKSSSTSSSTGSDAKSA